MTIINKNSLYQTVDNINQILFNNRSLSKSEANEVAHWIAVRQGLKGSYSNMIAPTDIDFTGIKLFTGDKLTSKASIAHILGEESLRVLFILKPDDKKVVSSLMKASSGIKELIKRNYLKGNYPEGFFCCGKCTVAYWRNLSSEGLKKNKKTLEAGIRYLKSFRDGKGKWGRFPYFYTLLALIDIDLPSAKEELIYASDLCRKYLNRKSSDNIYEKRKKEIARRVLEKI